MNKHFVVASAIRHLAMLLTDGYSTIFQQAAKAVASKGISIALPLSVAGLSSATLVNELIEQLENSPLPPRLLHLIIPADAILDHAESVQKLRLAGCRIVFSQVGRDLQSSTR